VSRGLGGVAADGPSDGPALSADGRIVAFWSRATNLVLGDTNGAIDVFAYDREQGSLERINVSSAEAQPASGDNLMGRAMSLSLTGDGRFVVFTSLAGDLVPGDTNGWDDVFVRDRLAGTTMRLSTFSNGAQIPERSFDASITPDGRYLVFSCGAPLVPADIHGTFSVYVRDFVADTIQCVSVSSQGVDGNDDSTEASISPDGRFVVFRSEASNLVTGDVNFAADVFVRDRLLGTTQRVSVSGQEVQGNNDSRWPRITENGRYVYFLSTASNLIPDDTNNFTPDIFVRDRRRGTTSRIGLFAEGDAGSSVFSLTPDGTHLALRSDSAPLGVPVGQVFSRVLPTVDPRPIY
jgi:Tol biopolymer transport system component